MDHTLSKKEISSLDENHIQEISSLDENHIQHLTSLILKNESLQIDADEMILMWLYNPIKYQLSIDTVYQYLTRLNLMHLVQRPKNSLYWRNLIYYFAYITNNMNKGESSLAITDIITFTHVFVHEASQRIILNQKICETAIHHITTKNEIICQPISNEIWVYLKHLYHKIQYDQKRTIMVQTQKKENACINQAIHTGYPLPHPTKGRPRLQLGECLYQNCHKPFLNGNSLKHHLINTCPNFIDKLHSSHAKLTITRDDILQNKLTKCPAFICDKHLHTFTTPEELIYHLEMLAVPGFWYEGWQPRKEDVKSQEVSLLQYVQHKTSITKDTLNIDNHLLIETDEKCLSEEYKLCKVCYDNEKNMYFFPCGHSEVCFHCYQKLVSKRCIFCRETIKYAFPVCVF